MKVRSVLYDGVAMRCIALKAIDDWSISCSRYLYLVFGRIASICKVVLLYFTLRCAGYEESRKEIPNGLQMNSMGDTDGSCMVIYWKEGVKMNLMCDI